MGIRDKPIAPSSPWQNSFAERLIGSIRRECVDHLVALGEHLRRVLKSYAPGSADRTHRIACLARRAASPIRPNLNFRHTQVYYNQVRTHLALGKNAPLGRAVQRTGAIVAIQSCPDCTNITSGYNFWKGQVLEPATFGVTSRRSLEQGGMTRGGPQRAPTETKVSCSPWMAFGDSAYRKGLLRWMTTSA
jgi:hypothetical protein